MNTEQKGFKYVIDTNYLIGFSIWLPVTYNENFWNNLEILVESGKVLILDVVANEVTRKGDLKTWCKKLKQKNLLTSIENTDRNRAIEINNLYPMIDETSGNSEVDTYIVAFSERTSHTLLSREAPRKSSNVPFKIPDVCNKLNINTIRWPEDFYSIFPELFSTCN
jgi:hypothetical protein